MAIPFVIPDHPGYGMSDVPPDYDYTPREQSEILERFVDRPGPTELITIVQDWTAR